MTQVGSVHGLTVTHYCAKVKKWQKLQFLPILNRKLYKIKQEKFEKVKNIKVSLEPHRRNGI